MRFSMGPAFVLWALALTATPAAALGADAPPASDHDQVIPVFLHNQRMVVMLRSGDHPPAPVVFDTGTNGNDLDTAFAKTLNLPNQGPGDVVDGATGNRVPSFKTTVPDAALSGAKVGAIEASVFDYPAVNEVGIVGPNIFSGRLVYLEIGRGRVRVSAKSAGNIPSGRAYPYLGKPGDTLPGIEVQLPGMTVPAVLDTGNDSTRLLMPLAFAHKLPLVAPPTEIGKARSVGGEQPVLEARVKGVVRIGSLTLVNPMVEFSGAGETANVGLFFIRQMSVVLDPEGERSWVLRPPVLTPGAMTAYAGRYGIRTVRVTRGRLTYQRDDQAVKTLKPIAEDLFELTGTETLIRFHRTDGRVIGFEQITEDGTLIPSERTH